MTISTPASKDAMSLLDFKIAASAAIDYFLLNGTDCLTGRPVSDLMETSDHSMVSRESIEHMLDDILLVHVDSYPSYDRLLSWFNKEKGDFGSIWLGVFHAYTLINGKDGSVWCDDPGDKETRVAVSALQESITHCTVEASVESGILYLKWRQVNVDS